MNGQLAHRRKCARVEALANWPMKTRRKTRHRQPYLRCNLAVDGRR
jgi:hypothetical protein